MRGTIVALFLFLVGAFIGSSLTAIEYNSIFNAEIRQKCNYPMSEIDYDFCAVSVLEGRK